MGRHPGPVGIHEMKNTSTYLTLAVVLFHVVAGFSDGFNEYATFGNRSETVCQSHPYNESASIVEPGNGPESLSSETPHTLFHAVDPGNAQPGAVIHRSVSPEILFRSAFRDICHLRV